MEFALLQALQKGGGKGGEREVGEKKKEQSYHCVMIKGAAKKLCM